MRTKRPFEMKPAIMKTFVDAYESMMSRKIFYPPDNQKARYRRLIHRQVASFANYLKDPDLGYQPFLWKV